MEYLIKWYPLCLDSLRYVPTRSLEMAAEYRRVSNALHMLVDACRWRWQQLKLVSVAPKQLRSYMLYGESHVVVTRTSTGMFSRFPAHRVAPALLHCGGPLLQAMAWWQAGKQFPSRFLSSCAGRMENGSRELVAGRSTPV